MNIGAKENNKLGFWNITSISYAKFWRKLKTNAFLSTEQASSSKSHVPRCSSFGENKLDINLVFHVAETHKIQPRKRHVIAAKHYISTVDEFKKTI